MKVREEESLNLTAAIWFAWGVLLNSGIGKGGGGRTWNRPWSRGRKRGEGWGVLLNSGIGRKEAGHGTGHGVGVERGVKVGVKGGDVRGGGSSIGLQARWGEGRPLDAEG